MNLSISRRQLLQSLSCGFGYLAFSSLATGHELHYSAKAKRVIFLCMRGGPSHVDTFDYKPALDKLDGKSGEYRGTLMKSPWAFQQQSSGLWISELFPKLGEVSSELCLLRGMHTDQPVHATSMTKLHTGNAQFVRPSLGSWALYGLGNANENLPGFISMGASPGSSTNYGNAFLPAAYAGAKLGRTAKGPFERRRANRSPNESVPDIRNLSLSVEQQREQLELIQLLNRQKLERERRNPGVEAVIESFESAFRMQSVLPDMLDLSQEDEETLSLYGIDGGPSETFGRQCLLARRLAEAGVRFIEIEHGNWDTHFNMSTQLPNLCEQIDAPISGLIRDLKRRGMLEETLVLWAGEFGRTPYAQNGNGRDHNNKGFTTWMAGGGVKGGFSYGATDETGTHAVEGKCHIHDWHATILRLLGLDHTRLTYRYAGRDFRLTDVAGQVLESIIA